MTPFLPALATLLALLLCAYQSINVGRARVRYKIDAPATTGDPLFERYFRVHQNTLEQLMLFLPSLWLCAYLLNPLLAALLGFVWLAGRFWYGLAYVADPGRRGAAFGTAYVAMALLWLGALVGTVRGLLTVTF